MSKPLEDFVIPKGAVELSLYCEAGKLYLDFKNEYGEVLDGFSRTFVGRERENLPYPVEEYI